MGLEGENSESRRILDPEEQYASIKEAMDVINEKRIRSAISEIALRRRGSRRRPRQTQPSER